MELHYNVTEDDYIEFNVFHYENSPSMKRQQLIVGLLLPAIALLYELIIYKQISLYVVLFAGVFTAIWFVFGRKIYRKSLVKNVKRLLGDGKLNEFVGAMTLALQDDTIKMTDAHRNMEVTYDSVQNLKMDDSRLYVYTGAISAFIVPFSAFKDEGEKQAFIALLKQKATNLTA